MMTCRRRRLATLGGWVAAVVSTGCVPPPAQPVTLAQRWMIGLERMRGDPVFLAPYTNRFLAALAAMPLVQVVYLGTEENQHLFGAWTGDRLRIYPWLRGEGNCMEITYTVTRSGEQQATYGLVVPALPAGPEPDSACVDRAATGLYGALVVQGL